MLTGWEQIPVCVAYDVDGVRSDEIPMTQTDFHHAKPIYEYLPGWTEDISAARELSDLPANAQSYVRYLEDDLGHAHQRDRRRPGPRRDDRDPRPDRMIRRPATRADLDRVRAVQPEWWGGRDLTALLQGLFLENFASTSLIVEDDDGSLAGFLIGFPSQDDPSAAYVHFIGVAPAHRGTGLGRALHDAFAERMAERGITHRPLRDLAGQRRVGRLPPADRLRDRGAGRRTSCTSCGTVPRRTFAPRSDPRPGDPPWPRGPVAVGAVDDAWPSPA